MKNRVVFLGLMLTGLTYVSIAWAAVELAKVNGRVITDKDLQNALAGLNQGQRESILKDINNRRELLIQLVDQEVLAQEAEKEKLDQTVEFKEAIQTFRKQFLAKALLEKKLGNKLTDAAAKKYYSAHKDQFNTDKVHVQHILVSSEAQAREMLKKAKSAGADFQALAEKNSKDPSAKNNRGDIGIVTHDSPYVPEFKNAALAASVGEIIGPVKTMYGYHIIKITEKELGKPLSYDEVELKVKSLFQQELVSVLVGELKAKAKIQVDEKNLNK